MHGVTVATLCLLLQMLTISSLNEIWTRLPWMVCLRKPTKNATSLQARQQHHPSCRLWQRNKMGSMLAMVPSRQPFDKALFHTEPSLGRPSSSTYIHDAAKHELTDISQHTHIGFCHN
ncbi:hypothetical protein COO60DRAFT_156660 [Scenedesmus sp. NREL 46B-D3]|nr:hypothetical protein COO60DRAFT_156660 [Scenedesmus sp. NREL 46B-D3]